MKGLNDDYNGYIDSQRDNREERREGFGDKMKSKDKEDWVLFKKKWQNK